MHHIALIVAYKDSSADAKSRYDSVYLHNYYKESKTCNLTKTKHFYILSKIYHLNAICYVKNTMAPQIALILR